MNSCSHVQSRRVFNHNDSKVQFQHIYIPDLCLSRFKREKSTHPCGVNFCGLFKKSYLSSFSFLRFHVKHTSNHLTYWNHINRCFYFFDKIESPLGGKKFVIFVTVWYYWTPFFILKTIHLLPKHPFFPIYVLL